MAKIRYRRQRRNAGTPDLFAWAEQRDRRTAQCVPVAARIIGRRYRLPLHRAELVCELAGIGGGE